MAKKLTDFGLATLQDRYFLEGEDAHMMYARISEAFAENEEHRDRLIRYFEDQWFHSSTPITSNGGTKRGLPISCFLNNVEDNMEGIIDNFVHNFWLSAKGGGTGIYYGNVREIGSKIRGNGKTSGVIPFIHMLDGMTSAVNQGSLRRASAAVYIDVTHPEIEEFLEIRKPSGDFTRKALNLHHGLYIPDSFMWAVKFDQKYELISPKTGPTGKFLDARSVWQKLLDIRMATGEPYLLFVDNANNKTQSPVYKKLKLKVTTSNLCSEIMLHTGEDYKEQIRTAVCCLASVNAATYLEWSATDEILDQFIEDVALFLDNVIEHFINTAPDTMRDAIYAAYQERSIGIGMMGWHTFLQQMSVPFDSVMAGSWNRKIWDRLRISGDKANEKWAKIKGACPDAVHAGLQMRWANMWAIAPTASISILCGGVSAGIEPIPANIYTHKTLSGSFAVKNELLDGILIEHFGEDVDGYNDAWESIEALGGSVQHLDFLDTHTKDVFKTAHEIDQMASINQAADRQWKIDQGQSLNIFLPSDVHKWDLHMLHWKAWESGCKALYYLRSVSAQRVDFDAAKFEINVDKYGECAACQ